MTRFTDGNKTIEIKMATWEGSNWSADWSADFFEVGSLQYNEDLDAYEVADVDYLVEYANDWRNGEGDFCDDSLEDGFDPENRLVDVTEIVG